MALFPHGEKKHMSVKQLDAVLQKVKKKFR